MQYIKKIFLYLSLFFILTSCTLNNSIQNSPLTKFCIKTLNKRNYELYTTQFAYSISNNQFYFFNGFHDTILYVFNTKDEEISKKITLPLNTSHLKRNLYMRNDTIIISFFKVGYNVREPQLLEYKVYDDRIAFNKKINIRNFYDYPIVDYYSNNMFYDLINSSIKYADDNKPISNYIFYSDSSFWQYTTNKELSIRLKDSMIMKYKSDNKPFAMFYSKGKYYLLSKNGKDICISESPFNANSDYVYTFENAVPYFTLYNKGLLWKDGDYIYLYDLNANW